MNVIGEILDLAKNHHHFLSNSTITKTTKTMTKAGCSQEEINAGLAFLEELFSFNGQSLQGVIDFSGIGLNDRVLRCVLERESVLRELMRVHYIKIGFHKDLSPDMINSLIECACFLKRADLSGCNLLEIPKAIYGLRDTIEVLNVGHNKIANIPPWIQKMKRLKKLDLSNNLIKKFPPELLNSAVKMLSLNFNSIEKIPDSIGQMSLVELRIAHNKIAAIPETINRLQRLKSLDLSGNKIKSVPEPVSWLSDLEDLLLAENKIAQVPGALLCMRKLKVLDLAENKIRNIDPTIVPLLRKSIIKNRKRIDLSGNYLSPESLSMLHRADLNDIGVIYDRAWFEYCRNFASFELNAMSDTRERSLRKLFGKTRGNSKILSGSWRSIFDQAFGYIFRIYSDSSKKEEAEKIESRIATCMRDCPTPARQLLLEIYCESLMDAGQGVLEGFIRPIAVLDYIVSHAEDFGIANAPNLIGEHEQLELVCALVDAVFLRGSENILNNKNCKIAFDDKGKLAIGHSDLGFRLLQKYQGVVDKFVSEFCLASPSGPVKNAEGYYVADKDKISAVVGLYLQKIKPEVKEIVAKKSEELTSFMASFDWGDDDCRNQILDPNFHNKKMFDIINDHGGGLAKAVPACEEYCRGVKADIEKLAKKKSCEPSEDAGNVPTSTGRYVRASSTHATSLLYSNQERRASAHSI